MLGFHLQDQDSGVIGVSGEQGMKGCPVYPRVESRELQRIDPEKP